MKTPIKFLLTPQRTLAALLGSNPFPSNVQARIVYHDQVVYGTTGAYMVEIWQPAGFNFYLVVHGQTIDGMQVGLQLCEGRYSLDEAANKMLEVLSPYSRAALDFENTRADTADTWTEKQQ